MSELRLDCFVLCEVLLLSKISARRAPFIPAAARRGSLNLRSASLGSSHSLALTRVQLSLAKTTRATPNQRRPSRSIAHCAHSTIFYSTTIHLNRNRLWSQSPQTIPTESVKIDQHNARNIGATSEQQDL